MIKPQRMDLKIIHVTDRIKRAGKIAKMKAHPEIQRKKYIQNEAQSSFGPFKASVMNDIVVVAKRVANHQVFAVEPNRLGFLSFTLYPPLFVELGCRHWKEE